LNSFSHILRVETWTHYTLELHQSKIYLITTNLLLNRNQSLFYMKELAMHLSQLDSSIIKKLFIHNLTQALNDLTLEDIWDWIILSSWIIHSQRISIKWLNYRILTLKVYHILPRHRTNKYFSLLYRELFELTSELMLFYLVTWLVFL
jgi:hypothetical protein